MAYDDHIYGEPPENFEPDLDFADEPSRECEDGDHDECEYFIRYDNEEIAFADELCPCSCHL